MNRRAEHFFGDVFRSNPEDEYLNIAIIPAKKRSRKIDETDIMIAKHELKHIIKEFKK